MRRGVSMHIARRRQDGRIGQMADAVGLRVSRAMNSTLTETPLERSRSVGGPRGLLRNAQDACERRPVVATLLFSLVSAWLLQLWRPFFFLTDDALADWLPPAVDAYRRLWEGRWPFQDDYVFGGVNLLDDAGSFTLLSPWALLGSFLARTPYYHAIPDVLGTLNLVTVAGAFCWSALQIRRRFCLSIVPGWIVALSLSYAFTPFNFIVNASWVGFFSAPAALPVIFAGACEPRWRRALAMQTAALLYAIFGGHMHPFTVLVVVGSVLMVALAAVQRRWQPLLVWAGAGTIAITLALPVLIPALASFGQDSRSAGLSVARASFQNVPGLPLLLSFCLGPLSHAFQDGIRIDLSDPLYGLGIGFALVNLPLLAALAARRRWSGTELCLLAGACCTAVSVVRPQWLGEIYAHLPLLRSLRWPFREIATLHFFTHTLFLFLFRPLWPGTRRLVALASGLAGTLAYALVFVCAAPTFWLFGPDRQLLISGEADRYWHALEADGGFRPGASFIVEAEPEVLGPWLPTVPFTVLGGFDHAALFRVQNLSGFSATPPASAQRLAREIGAEPYFWGGVYTHDAAMKVAAARPGTIRIVLTSMVPARWEVVDGDSTRRFALGRDDRVEIVAPYPADQTR